MSEFHWKNDWFFSRANDGSVLIRKVIPTRIDPERTTYDNRPTQEITAVIPAAEWASIVCSVSHDGETSERWNQAQEFHGR